MTMRREAGPEESTYKRSRTGTRAENGTRRQHVRVGGFHRGQLYTRDAYFSMELEATRPHASGSRSPSRDRNSQVAGRASHRLPDLPARPTSAGLLGSSGVVSGVRGRRVTGATPESTFKLRSPRAYPHSTPILPPGACESALPP